MMNEVCGESSLIFFMISKPEMPGRQISLMQISNLCLPLKSSASLPHAAVVIEALKWERAFSRVRSINGSSSTIRILFMIITSMQRTCHEAASEIVNRQANGRTVFFPGSHRV